MANELKVRDYLTSQGFSNDRIGYDENTKNVTIDGKPINSQGFTNFNGSYVAPQDAIDKSLQDAGILYPNQLGTQNNPITSTTNQQQPIGVSQSEDLSQYNNGYNELGQPVNVIGDLKKQPNNWYVSPYNQQINDALSKLLGMDVSKSPYSAQLSDLVNKITNRNFTYDPNTDQALQSDINKLSQAVLEEANSRGLVNSTIATDRLQQGIADLIPQYRDRAETKFNSDTNRMMAIAGFLDQLDTKQYDRQYNLAKDTLSFLQGLDDKGYQMYKDTLDEQYRQKTFTYQQEQDKIQNERQKIADAWARVQNLGYVDNETSIILRLPVGTLSSEAQKEIRDRQNQLNDYERQLNDQAKIDEKKYQQQLNIMRIEEQNRINADVRQEQAQIRAEDRAIANGNKESQSQITFNDGQTYVNTFKSSLIDPKTDEPMNPDSVEYVAKVGEYIDNLPLNEVQKAQLKKANLGGRSAEDVLIVQKFYDYEKQLDSMDKSAAYNRLVKNESDFKNEIGDYYYKYLLNKYK